MGGQVHPGSWGSRVGSAGSSLDNQPPATRQAPEVTQRWEGREASSRSGAGSLGRQGEQAWAPRAPGGNSGELARPEGSLGSLGLKPARLLWARGTNRLASPHCSGPAGFQPNQTQESGPHNDPPPAPRLPCRGGSQLSNVGPFSLRGKTQRSQQPAPSGREGLHSLPGLPGGWGSLGHPQHGRTQLLHPRPKQSFSDPHWGH